MPTIGLNIATMTLIGQNNGARLFLRVKEIYARAILYGCMIVIPMVIIVGFWAEELIQVFPNTSETTTQIAAYYLRIMIWLLFGFVIYFISVAALQGIKRPLFAVIVGVMRQVIVALPVFWILVYVLELGLTSLWWSIFLLVWISAIVMMVYTRCVLKKLTE